MIVQSGYNLDSLFITWIFKDSDAQTIFEAFLYQVLEAAASNKQESKTYASVNVIYTLGYQTAFTCPACLILPIGYNDNFAACLPAAARYITSHLSVQQ